MARRSTPLVDQGLRIYAICGGTYAWVRDTVKTEAAVRGVTVSKLIGEILQEWAARYPQKKEKDEKQGDLFDLERME